MNEKSEKKHESQYKTCKLCGKELSPSSLFCQNCGHPQGKPLMIALLIIFLILLLAFFISFMLFCSTY